MNSGLDIISVLTGLVSAATAVLGVWLKIKYDENKNKQLNYDPQLHGNVVTALEFILQETEADRSYVLEFHNGEHYFSGRSQQKLSCTYEIVSEGISVESQNIQNIRVSNFHGLVKSISQDQTFACRNVDRYDDDMSFRAFMQSKGVKSMFARPIKTLNGKIIGIIILEYVKEPRRWSDDAEEFLKKQSRIISGYLI
jgi:GAF domain-containing protein